MKKKKVIALCVGVAMLAGMFAGCGKPEDPKKKDQKTYDTTDVDWSEKEGEFTLYTYYTGIEKQWTDDILEKLKEKYPNVKINVEHRADADGETLKTRAAVGDMPDIIECGGSLVEIFQKSGDIISLDDAMEEVGFADQFSPGTFEGMQSEDGKYYAIQSSCSTAEVFYNKRVFEENGITEPTNYEEFKAAVEVLAQKDLIPMALFAQEKWPGLQLYDLAVIGEGEETGIMGLETGKTSMDDPAFVRAATKIKELVDMGMIGNGAFNTSADQAFELLSTGKAGMLFNGTWFFSYTFDYEDEIGYLAYNPFADEENKEEVKNCSSGGINSVGGYAVNANGSDPEFAKRITLDYVYYRDLIGSQKYAQISTLKETVDPEIEVTDAFVEYCEEVKDLKSRTYFEWAMEDREILMTLEDNVEKLYTGTYPVTSLIEDTNAAISAAVKAKEK